MIGEDAVNSTTAMLEKLIHYEPQPKPYAAGSVLH